MVCLATNCKDSKLAIKLFNFSLKLSIIVVTFIYYIRELDNTI